MMLMEHKAEIDWEAVTAAAVKAGVPYFTRRKWKERGSVPARWWPALIEASDGVLNADLLMQTMKQQHSPEAAQ